MALTQTERYIDRDRDKQKERQRVRDKNNERNGNMKSQGESKRKFKAVTLPREETGETSFGKRNKF